MRCGVGSGDPVSELLIAAGGSIQTLGVTGFQGDGVQRSSRDAWPFDHRRELGKSVCLVAVSELNRSLAAQNFVAEKLLCASHLSTFDSEADGAAGDSGRSAGPRPRQEVDVARTQRFSGRPR